jgi:preprotein translocase subunit SecA
MPHWWRAIRRRRVSSPRAIDQARQLHAQYARLSDEELRTAGRRATALLDVIAVTAAVATRVLGLDMFDVQLWGALALAEGRIVEMQTGEGKTLAAVPAVAFFARAGKGVHVLTANDYLARRDAAWMGPVYEWLGLSVAALAQGLGGEERRAAYGADITYATANEVGFDYLRDRLALSVSEQVQRAFAAAVIDEADSILIDQARTPLVIAGGEAGGPDVAERAEPAVRRLTAGLHYCVERHGRDVVLTDPGIHAVEERLACPNLFEPEHLELLTAVQDALHAHALLHRDVDYVVKEGQVLSVDGLNGRIVPDRRWPAGLQTALEWKEAVRRKRRGRVLGSITLENLVALYPRVCGMTGTAATQTDEFREIYGLEVEVLPTHRPVVRIDHLDRLFATREEKEGAVVGEIRSVHESGRPVLVGTASVEESERLSRAIPDLPHHLLNARNEEAEAAIVAEAGQRGAVTVSTNMAGRGVDIRLGPGVAALGGLHVVGTQRHESRRIDNQLRGRAGRQGDPGSSRFFVAREDTLVTKYAAEEGPDGSLDLDRLQRVAEGESLDLRLFLKKYESTVEGQRRTIYEQRQDVLTGETPTGSERERRITLTAIDELWSHYLAAVEELRAGTVWVSMGGWDPLRDYLVKLEAMFAELQREIPEEVAWRLAQSDGSEEGSWDRGATWTYLTTDQPFGRMSERFIRGLVRKVTGRGRA